jgi:hypothetical protein
VIKLDVSRRCWVGCRVCCFFIWIPWLAVIKSQNDTPFHEEQPWCDWRVAQHFNPSS